MRLIRVDDQAPDRFVVNWSPFNRQILDDVRVVHGRKWDPDRRVWTVPYSSAAQVRLVAERHDFEVTPDAAPLLAAADATQAYHVYADAGARVLTIRTGWKAELVEAVRAIDGSRWDAKRQQWRVPATEADSLQDVVRALRLHVHPQAVPILAAWGEEAAERRRLSRALAADLRIPGENPGLPLMPCQRAAVVYAEHARWRTWIADEPGVGKTLPAIAACVYRERWPVVVVCPSVAEIHWTREVPRFFPGRTARLLRGERAVPLDGPLDTPADFYVIGYPVVGHWLHALLRLRPQGLIVDESHLCKNEATIRTKSVKVLAGVGSDPERDAAREAAVPPDGTVLLLTGTPIENRTAEAVEQLVIMGRLAEFGGYDGFRKMYVDTKGLTKDERHARHLMLNEQMRATCLIRRRKVDVDPELPPKRRSFLWVRPEPRAAAEYRKAEADLLEYLADRARTFAAEMGLDPESEAVIAKVKARGAEALVRINTLRQIAAKAKLGAAKEWAQIHLASGEPLGVYAHHRTIVDTLAKELDGGKIQGGMSPDARQRVIDDFQDGRRKVAVLSIDAAGVAITLTAGSTALFVEQAWNAARCVQAEDRHHRRGQKGHVNITYMLAEGLQIESDMLETVLSKTDEVDAVTDGDDGHGPTFAADEVRRAAEDDDGRSAQAVVLDRYLRRALDADQSPEPALL